jgi:hypothetical protein
MLKWPDARLTQLIEAIVTKDLNGERHHLWGVEDDETEYALDAFLGLPLHPPCEVPGCPLHDPEFVKVIPTEAADWTAMIGAARDDARRLTNLGPAKKPGSTPKRKATVTRRRGGK